MQMISQNSMNLAREQILERKSLLTKNNLFSRFLTVNGKVKLPLQNCQQSNVNLLFVTHYKRGICKEIRNTNEHWSDVLNDIQ